MTTHFHYSANCIKVNLIEVYVDFEENYGIWF